MSRNTLVGNMGGESLSVHTVDGKPIGDFPCRAVLGNKWGREQTEVSIGDFSIATGEGEELLEDLRPWLHWITVWDNDVGVWTGPIQKATLGSETSTITARDVSTFMWRTRVPISRTWSETSPVDIALELWNLMLQQHRVQTVPQAIPTLADSTFTVRADADSQMLHQVMDLLVKVGLDWTVVGGRPVLGTFPQTPIVELHECDFLVEIQRIRDGTQTFNNVRVQGQNFAQTGIVPLAGMDLQGLVSLDDLSGVDNIQRATREYVGGSAAIRDTLYIPPGASLHPDAPVTLDDLVPGRVFLVHSGAVSNLMRLESMAVSETPESFDVQVSLTAIPPDLGQLVQFVSGGIG